MAERMSAPTPPPPLSPAGGGLRGWWGRWRLAVYLLLGLAAVEFVVVENRATWRAYDPDDYRERVAGCRRERPDLLVVGGSTAADGIDPAMLAGLSWRGKPLATAYNLGLEGATTSDIWHAVEHGAALGHGLLPLGHGLQTMPQPRLLVYGITASDLNDSRDEPHGPRSLMDAADVAVWVTARPAAAEWCVRQFAVARLERLWSLYAFRNGIRLWAADQAERLCPGACPAAAAEARAGLRRSAGICAGHGFDPMPGQRDGSLAALKAAGNPGPPFQFLDHYRLAGGHLSYLNRLLDWADARGVDVVLLDMPVSADLDQRLHPAEFAAYRAALAEVERSRGVRVERPAREALGLTDDDFADIVHLNMRGAGRLSAWLRGRLDNGRVGLATHPADGREGAP